MGWQNQENTPTRLAVYIPALSRAWEAELEEGLDVTPPQGTLDHGLQRSGNSYNEPSVAVNSLSFGSPHVLRAHMWALARVVSLTKSRKIPTRKIWYTALFACQGERLQRLLVVDVVEHLEPPIEGTVSTRSAHGQLTVSMRTSEPPVEGSSIAS